MSAFYNAFGELESRNVQDDVTYLFPPIIKSNMGPKTDSIDSIDSFGTSLVDLRLIDSRVLEKFEDPPPKTGLNTEIQNKLQPTMTKTTLSQDSLKISMSWSQEFSNGQFFIVFETVQQVGAGGSAHSVKIMRHALRTFNGDIRIYSSNTAEVFGDTNVGNAFTIETSKYDGKTVDIISKTTWDFWGNGSKNHTFTVRIIQAPSINMFQNITLT